MAPTRARSTPPSPPTAAGGNVRRPAFHFPANDNRPRLRGALLTLASALALVVAAIVLYAKG